MEATLTQAETTRATARGIVEAMGLTYWSDGPVTGTSWAYDLLGPVLVNVAQAAIVRQACPCGSESIYKGSCSYCGLFVAGTPAQRAAVRRAAELEAVRRDPRHVVHYELGAYPIGLRAPHPTQENLDVMVPFDRTVKVKHYPVTRAALAS